MDEVSTIGIDIAKNVFHLHGVSGNGVVVFRKKLPRSRVLEFLARFDHCLVALEACASAHYWGREIGKGRGLRVCWPASPKCWSPLHWPTRWLERPGPGGRRVKFAGFRSQPDGCSGCQEMRWFGAEDYGRKVEDDEIRRTSDTPSGSGPRDSDLDLIFELSIRARGNQSPQIEAEHT